MYDVYWLFEWGDVDLEFLPTDFANKCCHKGQDPKRLDKALNGKVETLDRLWSSRMAVQVPDLPHLQKVLRAVRRHLRGLELI